MTVTPAFPVSLPHNYAADVRQQWERFVSGALIEADKLRPIVRESWIRCRDTGLHPLQLPSPPQVSEEELASLREDELLSQHSPIVLQDILGTASLPPQSLIVVANPRSQAVHITGDQRAVAMVAAANVVPGAFIGESTLGTNVVSLACQTDQPAITYRAEHFYESLQPWQSCAVPIPYAETGRQAGIITLCSLAPYEWQAAFRFLFQAAQLLSLLIDNEEKSRRCLLLEKHQAQHLRYANDAILTIDREGFIHAVSPAFADLSRSLPASIAPDTSLSAVGLEIRGLTGSTRSHTPSEVEVHFRKQGREYTATVIPVRDPKRANPIGYVLTFPLPKAARSQTRTATPALHTPSDLKGHTFDTLIGKAPRFLHVVELARRAALYDDAVLLTGESGTGKELIAQAIHHASPRSHGPFIAVNCGGASEELIAAELFGYTAGAFTGALREGKRGKFELAHTGTLFLDEVGDMPLKMQQALLRAIEEQTITPLGAERSRRVDVRIIAATNANLTHKVREGTFRLDLFHRLNVLPIPLPPLRERSEDIPLLLEHFLSQGDRHLVIPPATLAGLRAYAWPGNIRELKNLVVRWTRFATHDVITPADLPSEMQSQENGSEHLREVRQELEKETILTALQRASGNVSQAALAMGVSRVTLYRKIKAYHLRQVTDIN